MANGYSKTTIIGHLGDTPSMRFTPNGKEVTDFSVAVNTGFGDYERTDWYDVVAWGKLAITVNEWLDKGSKCLVEGTMQKDTWKKDGQKRSKWKLIAREVLFLDSKGEKKQEEDFEF